MKRADYPVEVQQLVAHLKRLPGIGLRSAERIAVALLRDGSHFPRDLARAIDTAKSGVTACTDCGFFLSAGQACTLCSDPARDASLLCVVEQPTDILPLDRSGAFSGHYHVLGGRLSPLDGVHPEDLRIAPLLARIGQGHVAEVILAVGSDVEGEATANFLSQTLACLPVRITRLAQGLPAGGGLDSADELTLFRALQGRRTL